MTLALHYDHHEGVARAIAVREGKVTDCFFDALDAPQLTGAIYHGVVDRLLARDKGAFIKLDGNSNGFMSHAEGLASGQNIMVQVKSEAREGKGPGLTHNVSLPGIYLIHQPFEEGVHFSRRLDDQKRALADQHIHTLLEGKPGGWVLRRAALKASREAVETEIHEMIQFTRKLMHLPEKQALCLGAPTAFEQAILSVAGEGHLQLVIEKGTDIESLTHYLRQVRPSLLANLHITQQAGAFDNHDLNAFYRQLCRKQLTLPGGGNIVFEKTNTLTAIDVNAADRTSVFDINYEAAKMIMAQLRWRNIGGMIIVDFLKMKRPDDRHAINDLMRDEASHDAMPVDVFGFTRMGLCEVSRARRGRSLPDLTEGKA
jgi:ribonuclease E/ribonuclease G